LRRTVGDRQGEAVTLNNISSIYLDSISIYLNSREQQKALEYLNQALFLIRAVGDRTQEATILHNICSNLL
jgi:hypothetical protein